MVTRNGFELKRDASLILTKAFFESVLLLRKHKEA